LVVAYNRQNKFAAGFRDAAAGQRAWYEVLAMSGLRLGRPDPRFDPKG